MDSDSDSNYSYPDSDFRLRLPFPSYLKVELRKATEIARYCSIVQPSVSYLNLELGETHLYPNRLGAQNVFKTRRSAIFIESEESCRKNLCPISDLCYNLHLDVPRKMECSLKNVPYWHSLLLFVESSHELRQIQIFNIYQTLLSKIEIPKTYSIRLGKIEIPNRLYNETLLEFLRYFFEHYSPTPRIFTWICEFDRLYFTISWEFHLEITDRFASEIFGNINFHSYKFLIQDPNYLKFVNTFLERFQAWDWITSYEKPDFIKYFLYHLHLNGKYIARSSCCFLIELCIFKRLYLNIGPILWLNHVPVYISSALKQYKEEICSVRTDINPEALSQHWEWMGYQRSCRLLQIFWLYVSTTQPWIPSASDALRYIWDATSDPFMSFDEMSRALKGVIGDEVVDLYAFYSAAIGESTEYVQPRSLQHYCRMSIRSILTQNKQWIPDAIEKTRLPTPLKCFVIVGRVVFNMEDKQCQKSIF